MAFWLSLAWFKSHLSITSQILCYIRDHKDIIRSTHTHTTYTLYVREKWKQQHENWCYEKKTKATNICTSSYRTFGNTQGANFVIRMMLWCALFTASFHLSGLIKKYDFQCIPISNILNVLESHSILNDGNGAAATKQINYNFTICIRMNYVRHSRYFSS